MNLTFKAKIQKKLPGEAPFSESGLLKFQFTSPEYVTLALRELKQYKGEELNIIATSEERWTDKVNRLFHGIVRDIVANDAVQYWQLLGRAPIGFDETKEWCKVTFGGAEVKIVGSLSFIKSWKEFGKKQACQTIDNMIKYCMDQGLDIDSHKLEADGLKE